MKPTRVACQELNVEGERLKPGAHIPGASRPDITSERDPALPGKRPLEGAVDKQAGGKETIP